MKCPYCGDTMIDGELEFHGTDGVDMYFIPSDAPKSKWYQNWFSLPEGWKGIRLSPVMGKTPRHTGHRCNCGTLVFKGTNHDG